MSREESPAELLERLKAEREQAPRRVGGTAIAVTGSRDRDPTREEMDAFWRLLRTLEPVVDLHHGAATGVDRYVAAQVKGLRPDIRIVPHPANWRPAGPRGPIDRSAGPVRNRQMLTAATVLLAFPGGKGTTDCRRQAERMGRRILDVAAEVERYRLDVQQDHRDPGLWGLPS